VLARAIVAHATSTCVLAQAARLAQRATPDAHIAYLRKYAHGVPRLGWRGRPSGVPGALAR
jgi:hypothetical protein